MMTTGRGLSSVFLLFTCQISLKESYRFSFCAQRKTPFGMFPIGVLGVRSLRECQPDSSRRMNKPITFMHDGLAGCHFRAHIFLTRRCPQWAILLSLYRHLLRMSREILFFCQIFLQVSHQCHADDQGCNNSPRNHDHPE